MEQLERVYIIGYRNGRNIERQRVVDNLFKVVGRNVLAKEGIRYAVCNLLKRQVLYLVEERLWKRLDSLGHKQALVGCKSLNDSLFQGCLFSLSVGTVIFHIF